MFAKEKQRGFPHLSVSFIHSGDFLRKRILGVKVRCPPQCTRVYCSNCISGWYNYENEGRVSCPSCQSICFCTRCNRAENIEKLSAIFEKLGGNIDQLVQNSPASKMATKLLDLNPDIYRTLRDVRQDPEETQSSNNCESNGKNSEFGRKASLSHRDLVRSYNKKYKKLHLLKLLSKQLVVDRQSSSRKEKK